MLSNFSEQDFFDLLTKLATTPGPSLNETPRIQCIESFLNSNNIPYTTDNANNVWISVSEGSWEDTVVFDAHIDVVEKGYCERIIKEPDVKK